MREHETEAIDKCATLMHPKACVGVCTAEHGSTATLRRRRAAHCCGASNRTSLPAHLFMLLYAAVTAKPPLLKTRASTCKCQPK